MTPAPTQGGRERLAVNNTRERSVDEKSIIEGLKPVCQCQGINRKTVVRHIENGAHTLARVQQATGAGSGSCGGKRCSPRIETLLKAHLADPA